MADQQDVDEALVIRDDHVRISFVGRQGSRSVKTPQRVEYLVDDTEFAEQIPRCISALVERCGGDPHEEDERSPDDHDDPQREPGPNAENASFHRSMMAHTRWVHPSGRMNTVGFTGSDFRVTAFFCLIIVKS